MDGSNKVLSVLHKSNTKLFLWLSYGFFIAIYFIRDNTAPGVTAADQDSNINHYISTDNAEVSEHEFIAYRKLLLSTSMVRLADLLRVSARQTARKRAITGGESTSSREPCVHLQSPPLRGKLQREILHSVMQVFKPEIKNCPGCLIAYAKALGHILDWSRKEECTTPEQIIENSLRAAGMEVPDLKNYRLALLFVREAMDLTAKAKAH